MRSRDEIFKEFRELMAGVEGIQGVGLIIDKERYHFVVNIYSKHFKTQSKNVPFIFYGVNVEKRRVMGSRVLYKYNLATMIFDFFSNLFSRFKSK